MDSSCMVSRECNTMGYESCPVSLLHNSMIFPSDASKPVHQQTAYSFAEASLRNDRDPVSKRSSALGHAN